LPLTVFKYNQVTVLTGFIVKRSFSCHEFRV